MSCNQDCNQGRNCNCAGWHVVPLNDLREHDINGSCWCRPTLDELGLTEEEWNEMSDDERDELMKEIAFERLDWGYEVEGT